jgi:hypothetical protein
MANLGSDMQPLISGARNMQRKIIAVIIGMIVCQTVFSLLAVATLELWPDYAVHAHRYLDQKIFTFTSAMASMNLAFWVLGYFGAGWTTALIARDKRALWALISLMQFYAVYVHVLRSWSDFPWWYNLVIVFAVVPVTLSGGRLVPARGEALFQRCRLLRCGLAS